jgi:hypothetical protein
MENGMGREAHLEVVPREDFGGLAELRGLGDGLHSKRLLVERDESLGTTSRPTMPVVSLTNANSGPARRLANMMVSLSLSLSAAYSMAWS